MTKSLPDTDPLKREPRGAVSKVPHKEVDRTEPPAGKPDEQGGAATGGRPDKEVVATEPVQPGDDSPRRFGVSKESRNDQ